MEPLKSLRPVLVMAALLVFAAPAAAQDLRAGRDALKAGELDRAQEIFEKAAQQGSAEGRARVGQVMLKRRQLAAADEQFETALKMDPQLALGYWGRGEVLRMQEKCEPAVALYQKAVELDRKFPEAQLSLGRCLTELKRIDEALAAYNVGLKWGPQWRPAFLVGLGNAELARDSLRAASVYYTQAREEAPQDPLPRKALGDFYLTKRGIGELAVPEYEAAVALDSTDVELRYALAQGLFAAQRYNAALEQYRWVVAKDPEFAPGQLGLGNLLYLSGPADPRRYADAKPPLEKYTQLAPNDPRGWSLLGRTQFFVRERDAALASLTRAEQLGVTNKETYTLLGRLYAEKREYAKALAAFEKGEPSSRDRLIIAQMQAAQGNREAARGVYEEMIARDSTSADAQFALTQIGLMEFRAQDYAGAIGTFQRRIALDPTNDEAYYYVGLSHKELKQFPEALDALRQAAALGEGKADRHFWLGILYAQVDSIPQARRSLRRSLEIDSTGTFAGVAFRQLGYYELLDRDNGEAIQLLDRAVQLNDKDVQAWVWLGQGHQNSGNRTRAMECYRRALALDPNQADARKGLQALSAGAKPGGD